MNAKYMIDSKNIMVLGKLLQVLLVLTLFLLVGCGGGGGGSQSGGSQSGFVIAAQDYQGFTSNNGDSWSTVVGTPLNTNTFGVGVGEGYVLWSGEGVNGYGVYRTDSPLSTDSFERIENLSAGTSSTVYEVAYGNGIFVTVGNAGTVTPDSAIWNSPDGINGWQVNTIPGNTTGTIFRVSFGSGYFFVPCDVIVGQSVHRLCTSIDGVTWETRDMPMATSIRDVASNNSELIAIGSKLSDSAFWTSNDGISWQMGGDLPNGFANAIAYGNGTWVAVGGVTSADIWYSTDGISFTKVNLAGAYLNDVTFGNGIFMAVGQNGRVITSSDGLSWEEKGAPSDEFTTYTVSLYQVAYRP